MATGIRKLIMQSPKMLLCHQKGCSSPLIKKWFGVSFQLMRGRKDDDSWFSQQQDFADFDQEDESHEDMSNTLLIMERQQRSRETAMKYARATKGYPKQTEKRKLKWDTIEQIRFLYQEQPGDWTVPQLAESFGTSTSVIKKILKSKFVPNRKEMERQDKVVEVNIGLLEDRDESTNSKESVLSKKLLSSGTRAVLQNNRSMSKLKKESVKDSSKKKEKKKSLYVDDVLQEDGIDMVNNPSDIASSVNQTSSSQSNLKSNNISASSEEHLVLTNDENTFVSSAKHLGRDNNSYNIKGKRSKNGMKALQDQPQELNEEEIDEDMEEDFDFIITGEDLREFFTNESSKEIPRVVQRGREFYDEDGEFLYRV